MRIVWGILFDMVMQTLKFKPSRFYFLLSLLICAGYFLLFLRPNYAASENVKMVAVFEPDEYYPLRFVFNMIQPAESVGQAVRNFVLYKYYFYGFPYFAASALSLIPVSLLGRLNDTSVVMVVLRQAVSVLPMLGVVLLLIQLQTRFQSYKTIVLLFLLLSVPAVVRNNFWWHPDGLAILFSTLVIVFLNRDQLKFGRDFYLAAVMCGVSAATKGIGFYFFLSVSVYIIYGYLMKSRPVKALMWASLGFLAAMGIAYLCANPMLVSETARNSYFSIMQKQSALLSSGYQVVYAKGFFVALPTLTEYYGSVPFLLVALSACMFGILQDRDRLLNLILLTWLVPISVLIFWITHFKFQYWLPVALPLFSSLALFLPDTISWSWFRDKFMPKNLLGFLPQFIALTIAVVQFFLFVLADIQRYEEQVNRSENNPAIQFYDLAQKALEPLGSRDISLYHDVQMYVPDTRHWDTESTLKILDYGYIQSNDFHVILLMQQRIYDYRNPDAQGIDPGEFALSQKFYRDAQDGTINGYKLVFRNDFGLIFVRDDLYLRFFEAP